MKNNTRYKLVEQAEILFAKNGFDGTSINDIAVKLNITKQALLHHFSNKNKLYAAVMGNAANYLIDQLNSAIENERKPKQQFEEFILELLKPEDRMVRVMLLTIRELLDNQDRAKNAGVWYMQPWLDQLIQLVELSQQDGHYVNYQPLTLIYHLLGAIQYALISQLTLEQIYGAKEYRRMQANHESLILMILNA